LFVTPQDIDLAALSAAAGVGHTRVERMPDLVGAVRDAEAGGGVRVIEVPTPAERSRRQRVDVRAVVDAALAGP
jgi:2-succinyl-5-enolpyruvyl-6-hydroxy-3-cyclohexene-1-carboxylate synthase